MTQDQEKTLERQLWNIADQLFAKMNADELRDYYLGLIFYKYLSERLHRYVNYILSQDGIDFIDIDESSKEGQEIIKVVQEEAITELGYFLHPAELFHNLAARVVKNPTEFILEDLTQALHNIENSSMGTDSEEAFDRIFEDLELTSTKLGRAEKDKNALIARILVHLDAIDFRLDDSESDVLGDVYEHLIGQFASGVGKKAGEFYTPQQVSTVLARIVTTGKKRIKSVYDPTCGSGSLLLRVAREVDHVGDFYGQEMNRTTYNLARMNMILHGVHYHNFSLKQEDTLERPQHLGMKFDAVVANPPFSVKWSASKLFEADDRFSQYGRLAPSSKADFAFIQHMLYHLDDNGTMAVVAPHGVLFRGGAERDIRQKLIEENLLDAVIGLPANVFYGTGISTAILIFKRNKPDRNVLFIDASQEFKKEKSLNYLPESSVEKIVSIYKERRSVDLFASLVRPEEISENDFILNIPRYVITDPSFLDLELPDNHKKINLGDIVTFLTGIPRGSLEQLNLNSDLEIPYIQVNNITEDGELSLENVKYYPYSINETPKQGYAFPGDILISTTNLIGRVAIVPKELTNGVYFNVSIHGIRIDNPEIDNQTVFHSLRMDFTQAEFYKLAVGSTIPRITTRDLKNIQLIILPQDTVENKVIAQTIIRRLNKDVIEPLASQENQLDDLRDIISVVLGNVIFTLKGTHLSQEEQILQLYPLPISLGYHRVVKAAYNPYEQLSRLIELYETITYFFYNTLLCDYFYNKKLQSIYTPSKSNIKRAYESYPIAHRLTFINEFISGVKEKNAEAELKIPEIIDANLFEPLNRIRNIRNTEFHSVSGSKHAQINLIEEINNNLKPLLLKLSFLKNYSMCRVDSYFQSKGKMHARLELFTGASYETNIEDRELTEDANGNPKLIRVDQSHIILLTPDDEWINLYPFYQLISTKQFRYEPHLCFAKSIDKPNEDKSESAVENTAKDDNAKGVPFLAGESIQFRSSIPLDGYDYLIKCAIDAGLRNEHQQQKNAKNN